MTFEEAHYNEEEIKMAITWRDCEHMYRTDPAFQRLCKSLEQFLESCEMTPSDLRAAIMFVVTRHEMKYPPAVHITAEEWIKLTQTRIDPEIQYGTYFQPKRIQND